ncbi:DNA mismatch repair protein MutS [Sparassis latifolia]
MPRGKQTGFRAQRFERRTTAKRNRIEEEPVDIRSDSEETPNPSASAKQAKRVRWGGSVGTSEDTEDEEDDNMITNGVKICLAASCQFGRIGCAYYDPVKCTIHVFEDTQENKHFDLTKMILGQASPDIALTSSKADDNFMNILRDHMGASGGTFQIRPHKDFSTIKGRDRVLSLRLLAELPMDNFDSRITSDPGSVSEPRNAYDFMRSRGQAGVDPTMQCWNASIRLSNYASLEGSPLCLGSIGALLDHLARVRAVGSLEDEGVGGLEVRGIEALTLEQTMQLNADALFSLQIFEDETHASIHSDKTKEGLSLFGILNNTKTTLGRAMLREWLLRPSMSLPIINARHDALACFLRPENQVTADAMHTHLKGIKNVPRILAAMRAGRAKVSDWQGLVKFTFHTLMLRDALFELAHASSVPIVKRLIEALDVASSKEVGTAVNETVDWEESANAGRICVRPHIDEELDRLKHIYNGIDAVLSRVAQNVSAKVPPDYASTLNVVYFPQLGFLVCVPMLEEWKTEQGITVLDGWSFQMHDMDNHIGDLHPSIVDREIEIVQSLQDRILVYDEHMGHACDVCAELDCLLSFAQASRACDYRQPQMTEDNILDIKQGRHPLQEIVVDTFVPNDAFLVGGAGVDSDVPEYLSEINSDEIERRQEQNSIIICTGANACGKCHIFSSFVPAESATLGVVDKIFTRIQTRESVSRVQSAFMIDLNQVSLALRNSTARSLILLDEFGKGTISADGAGLLCGVLKHLAQRGSGCPKVLAATHFHDIFTDALLAPRALPLTLLHMQVMLTTRKGKLLGASAGAEETEDEADDEADTIVDEEERATLAPGERITYLYRVAKGLSLDSHAALCAEIFGVPRRVAQRARHVSKLLAMHALGQLLDEEMGEEERKDLQDAEDVCRRFLAWELDRYARGSGNEDQDESDGVKSVLAQVLGREVEE